MSTSTPPERRGESSAAQTLRDLADGRITPAEARAKMRGVEPPNGAARLVKQGRWAVGGAYPTGVKGARMAAREALRGLA